MVDIVGTTTFPQMWDAAVRCAGDRVFLAFLHSDGTRLEFTYREFDKVVSRTVSHLSHLGIGHGSMVAMQLCNSPWFISCLIGITKLGAIAVPVGPGATGTELAGIYATCDAQWAIVESIHVDTHKELRFQGLIRHGIICVDDLVSNVSGDAYCDTSIPVVIGVSQYASPDAPPPDTRPNTGPTSDDIAEVMFTSGTTAAPKGVLVTHANLVYSAHVATWQASLRPDDRIFTTMPACHSNFQLVALTGAILSGARLVLSEKYSASRFWSQIRTEKATVIQLTAMMARTLLLQPSSEDDSTHNVRETLYFMPLPDADKLEFEKRFGVRFMNSYGSTESICWALTDPPVGERKWPSVGRPALGYEVSIVSPEGDHLPAGSLGEIWVKGVPGRTLMKGYLGNDQATHAALTEDGWLRTSDTGYYDEQGWFYFVDRARNLIKRGGENISATEIETLLNSHPLIKEAAVIGVPDPVRDQAVKAFIQPESDAELDTADVASFCSMHLASFKVPQIIEFVEDFPRTASMKIEKRSLS
ncbi:MAG: AMP-binding protein [Propionibacteriaceae bacterium]|jgi:crotonobetaine/carnitine-CoA ligase|nr:AMP-binding protein [Propionibacteriaceae bacterium]